jgi:hypothetical protein
MKDARATYYMILFYRIIGQRLTDELMTTLSVYVVLGKRNRYITFVEIDYS